MYSKAEEKNSWLWWIASPYWRRWRQKNKNVTKTQLTEIKLKFIRSARSKKNSEPHSRTLNMCMTKQHISFACYGVNAAEITKIGLFDGSIGGICERFTANINKANAKRIRVFHTDQWADHHVERNICRDRRKKNRTAPTHFVFSKPIGITTTTREKTKKKAETNVSTMNFVSLNFNSSLKSSYQFIVLCERVRVICVIKKWRKNWIEKGWMFIKFLTVFYENVKYFYCFLRSCFCVCYIKGTI